MPVVILTGLPSSGKSKTAEKLKNFFESKLKHVVVISENNVIKDSGLSKNAVYSDSKKEKELRSKIKSEFLRAINSESVVIVDALNYIKGYRYELYCACKSSKTTQCTIHCQTGAETCWEYNAQREPEKQYIREIFDGLVLRFEPPDSRNRWDSPLFYLMSDSTVPFEEVYEALYCRKPPPPNQSTQCPPLSATNFLHDLDNTIQDVISSITSAKKLNMEGEIKIPGCDDYFFLSSEKNSSLPELLRMKRQFLSYVKLHPTLYTSKDLKNLFVQYLNTNL